ncbi:MAG: sigma 54-interacting transcriptional regulator [Zymomonas mobilis]
MNDTVTLEINVIDSFEEFSHCFTGECRVAVLPILYKISQVLVDSADFTASIPVILDTMQNHLKMQRGIITLYDRHVDTIFIHDSFGLSEEEKTRGIYAVGEGVTGKVVEKGKAIVAKRLIQNPDFLNRTQAYPKKGRSKAAFFSLPIIRGQKVLGTIGAERVYINPHLLRQDLQLLAMIAAMMAPAVELYMLENIEKVRLENENRRLKNTLKERFKPSNIIGCSKPMQDIYQLIHKVAATKATVLILGESGVGKELVATAIHYNSPSADGPFIKANCAAFPESLAESELFGHEKGAFTGAIATHKGFFEQADGGTIFLDEVGELSLSVQTKLLRVLQERSFQRVGGNRPINIDVRIIAATNRDLAKMVEEGSFREDLYYRLNVFPMMIPPLRDRGSDVITLADHFVKVFAEENGKNINRISTPALNMLMGYHWPGNVRELENVIERAVILADDKAIHSYDLPPSLQTEEKEIGVDQVGQITLEARIQAIETKMIIEALKKHNGHMGDAAKELGLTRRMLSVRMEKYDISYKTFRSK